MSQSIQARNKVLVLEAFDTLFNKRDYYVIPLASQINACGKPRDWRLPTGVEMAVIVS
jgi:hypothetical protein